MEKILSQDEVDALLRGIDGGDVDTTPKEEPPTGIRPYDLANQDRVARSKLPTLDIIMDRFLRLQTNSWSTVLYKSMEFSVQDTAMMKFSEFLKNIPVPSSLTLFTMHPLRGRCLFVMDAMLVYLLVDFFYGGAGQTHVKPEGREFTPIQTRVIKTLTDASLADLQKAWAPVTSLTIQAIRYESNPQFAMIAGIDELVIAVTMRIYIGDNARDFIIAYPYALLEPIKDKLQSGFVSDHIEHDSRWITRFQDNLRDCLLDLTIQLGTTTIPASRLLTLRPGDIIPLDQKHTDYANCLIEGRPRYHCLTKATEDGRACAEIVAPI